MCAVSSEKMSISEVNIEVLKPPEERLVALKHLSLENYHCKVLPCVLWRCTVSQVCHKPWHPLVQDVNISHICSYICQMGSHWRGGNHLCSVGRIAAVWLQTSSSAGCALERRLSTTSSYPAHAAYGIMFGGVHTFNYKNKD